MPSRFDFDRPYEAPFELMPVEPTELGGVPEAHRPRIFIHTVHDGDVLPSRFRVDAQGNPLVPPEALDNAHAQERDWGANLVAESLAHHMGLTSYGRVRIARTLLDVNRFPGSTPPSTTAPLERLSINPPFCDALGHAQKMDLLEIYDEVSDTIEHHVRDKIIILGIHTYDEHNPSLTSRPHLSLINLPAGYQREARMPYGVFDPIYPDVLGESTCSRILRDRISLNLERAGFRVTTNHPYALPEGGIEVRSQVWFFFSYLQRRFLAEHADTAQDPAFALVWKMLLNTNLRQALPEALRGYLHRYRRAPREHRGLFAEAANAYDKIRRFIDDADICREYRRSPDRPSSLAVEVRKDLLCEMDPQRGTPLPTNAQMRQRAHVIAKVVAGAIRTYLDTDRPLQETAERSYEGRDDPMAK